jgi:site-specific DNA recombinase
MPKYKRNKLTKNKKLNNNTAIIYYRVSFADQVDGTSLEMQLRECRKYCEAHNIEVLAVFEERGQSAKSINRTEFLKAINYCRKHKVGAFVVWKIDRFARNTEDHFAVRATLMQSGTRLVSVTEPTDNSPTGKLMETMLAATAEFDNSIRSIRCYGGMMDRIRMGIYPHKPPVGYICEQNKKKDEKKTRPDPRHPQLGDMIAKALRGYMEKRYSQKGMVQVLNEEGFETYYGIPANHNIVDRMLRHNLDYYSGRLYCAEDDKYYKGQHVPLITEDEMNRIIEVRDGAPKFGVKKERHNPEFPLRRTVRCGYCDHALTGSCPNWSER